MLPRPRGHGQNPKNNGFYSRPNGLGPAKLRSSGDILVRGIREPPSCSSACRRTLEILMNPFVR
jgi:hypothetical protein